MALFAAYGPLRAWACGLGVPGPGKSRAWREAVLKGNRLRVLYGFLRWGEAGLGGFLVVSRLTVGEGSEAPVRFLTPSIARRRRSR